MTKKRPPVLLILCLTLFAASLACLSQDLYFEEPELFNRTLSDFDKTVYADQKTGEALKTAQALTPEPPASDGNPDTSIPLEDTDDRILFSYSGENQSFHTGLRDRTVFHVDYGQGKVSADESAPFTEPAGCQTAAGTDTVSFDGVITGNKVISGDLTITTEYTATGCGGTDTTVKYAMNGTLSAQFADGQWTGTVTGTSSLDQTWAEDGYSPQQTTHHIEWAIVGTPVD